MERDKEDRPRCWCCGTKFVDKARTMNERLGAYRKVYRPTGEMVCPNGCPSKEEYEKYKAGADGLEDPT